MDKEQKQVFKTLLYEQFARVGKAFANARRLEMIDLLIQAPHTVEELAKKTELSVASASQHLQVLRQAQIVKVKREGTYAWYSIADEDVFPIWKVMRELALSRVAEIDHLLRDYFEERYALETISADELLQRMRDDNIIILDVRPADEYEAGHIPSAISIPAEVLAEHLDELSKDFEIVAYCRASYCLLSDEAALLLREKGYKVRVFQEGFPIWKAKGLPFETGTNQNIET